MCSLANQNAPTLAAARMRRVRQRRRSGLRFLTIELRKSEITALIRSGYLRSDQTADNEAIKTALYSFFEMQLEPLR
jgi:hypothetical protein